MDTRQRRNHSASPLTGTVSRRAALAQSGVLAMVLASSTARDAMAQATPPEKRQLPPNHFVLSGEGTSITFDTSSFNGLPRLSYQGGSGDLSFAGEEIVTTDSEPLGRLVTVLIEVLHDGYTLDFTLLLPAINMTSDTEPQPFSTLAILTKHLTTIGGPGLIEGALTTYEAVVLEGTAESVQF